MSKRDYTYMDFDEMLDEEDEVDHCGEGPGNKNLCFLFLNLKKPKKCSDASEVPSVFLPRRDQYVLRFFLTFRRNPKESCVEYLVYPF